MIKNWTSPCLVMIIKSTCFLVLQLNTHVLSIVFTIEFEVVNKIQRCVVQSLSNMWLHGVYSLILTERYTNQI